MPRVGTGRSGGASGTSRRGDRLDQCLEALLQNPDAACVGGGELCCGGCESGGGELVEALAAFVSHSDAARRRFVARGGMESINVIVSKTLRSTTHAAPSQPGPFDYQDGEDDEEAGGLTSSSDDTRALGALVILQSLTASVEGQTMMLQRCPELLQAVCQLALLEDMEAEGLRHAALQLLGGWHYRSAAASTAAGAAAGPAPSQGPKPIAAWLLRSAHAGDGSSDMLSIGMQSAHHPMAAVRKAAAQLFATAAVIQPPSSPAPPGAAAPVPAPAAKAVALLSGLASRVNQVLAECEQGLPDACLPLQDACLQGPLTVALLVNLQESVQKKKLQVQALVELVCALLEEPEGPELLHSAAAVRTLLRVFTCAWDLPLPTLPVPLLNVPPSPAAVAAGAKPAAAGSEPEWSFRFNAEPGAAEAAARQTALTSQLLQRGGGGGGGGGGRALLQDHHEREQVLDALLLLLRHADGLGVLGALGGGAAMAQPAPAGCLGGTGSAACAAGACRCAHLAAGIRLLQRLVKALLHKETPAHIRSALALLGAVRCARAGPGRAAGDSSSGGEDDPVSGTAPGAAAAGPAPFGAAERATAQDGGEAPAAASPSADQLVRQPGGGDGQQQVEALRQAVLDALTQLLELLCHVFDCAWTSEREGGGAGACLPELPPPEPPRRPAAPAPATHPPRAAAAAAAADASAGPKSVAIPPGPGGLDALFPTPQVPLLSPGSSGGAGPEWPFTFSAAGPASPPKRDPSFAAFTFPLEEDPFSDSVQRGGSADAAAPELCCRPALRVELGLGYRVLVQVLQAWRQLSDSGDPGVAAALGATCWGQRVALARLHDRAQVVAAAQQVRCRDPAAAAEPPPPPPPPPPGDASRAWWAEMGMSPEDELQLLSLYDEDDDLGLSTREGWEAGVASPGSGRSVAATSAPLDPGRGSTSDTLYLAPGASSPQAPPALPPAAGWEPGPVGLQAILGPGAGGRDWEAPADAGLEQLGPGDDPELLEFLSLLLVERGGAKSRNGPGPFSAGDSQGQGAGAAEGAAGDPQAPGQLSTDMFEPWDGTGLPTATMPSWPPASTSAAAEPLELQPVSTAGPQAAATGTSSSRAAAGAGGAVAAAAGGGNGASSGVRAMTEQQLVQEALSMLPDLDAVANKLCAKYDTVELAC